MQNRLSFWPSWTPSDPDPDPQGGGQSIKITYNNRKTIILKMRFFYFLKIIKGFPLKFNETKKDTRDLGVIMGAKRAKTPWLQKS